MWGSVADDRLCPLIDAYDLSDYILAKISEHQRFPALLIVMLFREGGVHACAGSIRKRIFD